MSWIDRAGRDAEGVDAAHVAEHALADRMNVVVADSVVVGVAPAVAPGPADRDAGVVEIEDVVVLDDVVGRVADPDADGRRVQPPAVGDQAVDTVLSLATASSSCMRFRRSSAAAAEVGQLAVL